MKRCAGLAAALLLTASLYSSAQTLLTSVATGSNPIALAVNAATNKIYVVNQNSNSVTVIDGTTNNTATVAVGASPDAIAVNATTNKIYVANTNASTVTVIDGATNRTSTISTGTGPFAVAVNSVTNKIYVANYNAGSVTVIDGATNGTSEITVGARPYAVAVNSVTNQIFVTDSGSGDVAVIDGATNTLMTRVAVGVNPHAIAINLLSQQIYVANFHSGTVSVIDGATYAVTNVTVGTYPAALAVDPLRYQVLVANSGSSFGTLIDGATLSTSTIATGASPVAVDVDSALGNAYFADNDYQGTFTMFNENSGATTPFPLGGSAAALSVDSARNRIYVALPSENQVAVLAGGNAAPLQFVPVTPCRIADTRGQPGPFGGPYLSGGSTRSFIVPQSACGIPTQAVAYALNVTVAPRTGSLGFLAIWPTGEAQPLVSTLNSPDGRVKANAAIVVAGAGGAVSVYVSNSTDVILDVNGYFQSAAGLQFYPVPLCRVFDTRWANGALGGPHLQGGYERDFPILAGNCHVPASAMAYSMNFTVQPVAGGYLDYLTVWPAGSPQPLVSTLNNPTATTVANAAIVPAGTGGAIAVFADRDTQLVGDINGYFAGPGTGGLSLYPLLPCRVIDTRLTGGAFTGQRSPPVNVAASPCLIPAAAQEYVFNVTAVPVGSLGYLTLWADGDPMPGVSTLNASDGVIASNMAIIGNRDGKSDAYAAGTTQLILDISSYFAP
jgi:YVTN family beta-propeller protein